MNSVFAFYSFLSKRHFTTPLSGKERDGVPLSFLLLVLEVLGKIINLMTYQAWRLEGTAEPFYSVPKCLVFFSLAASFKVFGFKWDSFLCLSDTDDSLGAGVMLSNSFFWLNIRFWGENARGEFQFAILIQMSTKSVFLYQCQE